MIDQIMPAENNNEQNISFDTSPGIITQSPPNTNVHSLHILLTHWDVFVEEHYNGPFQCQIFLVLVKIFEEVNSLCMFEPP
jgi:hypothetical protein